MTEIEENLSEVLKTRTPFYLKSFRSFNGGRNLLEFGLLIILSAMIITFMTSLLKNVIFPPVNVLLKRVNVPDWKIVLSKKNGNEIAINIGDFIETIIITLTIGSIALALLLHVMGKTKKIEMEDAREKVDLRRIINDLETLEMSTGQRD